MIAGVDEAGRGCIAGPVVAAAVILSKPILGLNDSKALSAKRRAALFSEICANSTWSFAVSSVDELSKINIRQASLLAMQRSVHGLLLKPSKVMVDGCDQIKIDFEQEAVVGGDHLIEEIMAASIIAKYIRDQLMQCIHIAHPQYGFNAHKGYGTKAHIAALDKHGLLLGIHRHTFRPCSNYV